MFRLIRLLFFLALVALVVAGTYFWVSRVPSLERTLSRRLGTEVTLQGVDIGLGHLTLVGLKIADVEGSGTAFQAKKVRIEASPFKLWRETVHIGKIALESPTVSIQLYNASGSDNNWAKLMKNLPESTPSGRRFMIDELTVTNLRFEATRANGKALTLPPIPYLEFRDLGHYQPLTLTQIGRVIFQTILKTISKYPDLGLILDNVSALPKALINGVQATLPNETLQQGLETLKNKGKEATNLLQDLFSTAIDKFSN